MSLQFRWTRAALTLTVLWAGGFPATSTAAAPLAATTTFGVDIRVSADNPGHQHKEHFGAADPLNPLHFLAGANDLSSGSNSGVWVTFNGGQTWSGGNLPGPYLGTGGPYTPSGDPTGDFDALGNTFFADLANGQGGSCALGLYTNAIYSHQSSDGGLHWTAPVQAARGGALGGAGTHNLLVDKPWIAVDKRAAGLRAGRVYLTYDVKDLSSNCQTVNSISAVLRYSDDHGLNWSAPITVSQPSTPQPDNQFVYGVVANDGTVYVGYNSDNDLNTSQHQLYVTRSADGGQTFSLAFPVSTSPISKVGHDGAYLADAVGHTFGTVTAPMLAASPSNSQTVYVVWNHHSPDPGWSGSFQGPFVNGGVTTTVTYLAGDIAFARTTNGGQSWSAPLRLNDDPANPPKDHFLPAIAISPNGLIHVTWYDRRNDPQNLLYDLYYTSSADGGLTWSSNQRVTDVASDPAHTSDFNFGDYNGLAATDPRVLALWTDQRAGTPSGEKDLFTDIGLISGATFTPTAWLYLPLLAK